MGQRGPKPLPPNVHRLRGNASHLAKAALERGSIEPEVAIPRCPAHLLPEAKAFWKRLTPELEQLGLVSRIDQAALALVCQEWGWLVWHESQLQRDIALAKEKRAAFEVAEERKRFAAAERGESYEPAAWTGGDGYQVPTPPSGALVYAPHWVARNRHAMMLDKFLASFGMSPSSRGRVTASTRQLALPGMPDPAQGFGAL